MVCLIGKRRASPLHLVWMMQLLGTTVGEPSIYSLAGIIIVRQSSPLLALALTEGVILRRERSELPINFYPPQPKARGYPKQQQSYQNARASEKCALYGRHT
jgi:hypothetical protein